MRIKSVLLFLSVAVFLSAGVACASPILLSNGNFESTTNGTNKQLSSTVTSDSDRSTLTGWTSSNGNDGGYNFVLDSSIATTNASAIWLKSNGYSASHDGGNFFASDPLYFPGTLSQNVNGLLIGSAYTLTFEYALAQQVGFTGENSGDFWQVGFGDAIRNTSLLSIADGGFSGWKTATMTFTATSTSEVLSFLAKGASPGAPPFMLLDGVSLVSAVPEPSTWSIVLGGLILIGLLTRRRRAAQA
jgi:hypothetical protein